MSRKDYEEEKLKETSIEVGQLTDQQAEELEAQELFEEETKWERRDEIMGFYDDQESMFYDPNDPRG